MRVKNLVSWAGARFHHAPGAIIDLPDETAKARIEAGLCVPVDPTEGTERTRASKQ